MKMFGALIVTFALSFTLGLVANPEHDHENPNHPCKEIAEACKAAGFHPGEHKSGKGLWKDCVKPVMAGTAVEGVKVTQAQIDACRAKKAARPGKGAH